METQAVFGAYRKDQEIELLRLWRSSFNGAIGLEEDRREEAFQEHLEFLRSLDPSGIRVALEKTTNQMMGFMRKEGTTIHDLFIHTEHQRAGLGSEFIRQAKQESDFLSLSTFELNRGAQKFYELHGFKIVHRGFASLEDNPWATRQDQLADLTYEWKKHAGGVAC